jgi:hypothetical protein
LSLMTIASAVHPDTDHVHRLRDLAETDQPAARVATWQWLTSLDATREPDRLDAIFRAGTAPEDGPVGPGEGRSLGIMGTPFLGVVHRLERLGQALGGIGWTGKTFHADGTGFNRLTRFSRYPMFLAMPRYAFTERDGEITGFSFDHAVSPSPRDPDLVVRGITYDNPAYGNPIMLPRTRDELVEIVPDVYLGRALLREDDRDGWDIVAYFAQRHPIGG